MDSAMARFVARRLLSMVLVLFAVSVLVFLIFNVVPNGDPAVRMAGKIPTETQIEAIREEWGFDEPLYVQYATMMKKLFTGDMVSYFTQLNVTEEIWKGAPRTFALAIGAAIIWMAFAIALGVFSAVRAGAISDRLLTVLALIGISMPVFWLGPHAQPLPRLQGGDLPQRRLRRILRKPHPVVLAPRPALVRALDPLHRLLLPRPALRHHRDDGRGLRPHRARQGALRAPRPAQARAAQLADPDRHALGPRLRRRDRRRPRSSPRRSSTCREWASMRPTRSASSTCRRSWASPCSGPSSSSSSTRWSTSPMRRSTRASGSRGRPRG